MYPKFWKKDPKRAIKENKQRVLVLVHTKWWNKAPLERLKLDLLRILEKIKYRGGKQCHKVKE